jgi:hypothetical protein
LSIPSLCTRGIPLHAFTNTPMHLIPLGVGKMVFFWIMTWSARRGRKNVFVAIAKGVDGRYKLIETAVATVTLLPSTIKDKWGGWVSKNYASLLCVALWVFAPIMTIDDADAYTNPTCDPTKWTVKMYQLWLQARGLDAKGKRNDLLERVLPFFVPDVIAPPILPQQYATANEMIEMLQLLVLMVATVFQKSVDAKTKNLLDLRLCIFLTRFQRFDKPMRKKDRNPNWLTTYNMMCLLNLLAPIKEFGPVRLWNEGKWLGERYVLTVKSERLKCLLSNLHYILLQNLLRNKAVDLLNPKEKRNNKEEQLPMNTKVHNNEDELLGSFLLCSLFPITRTINDKYYSLCYGGERKSLKRVMQWRIDRSDIESPLNLQHGLIYWKFELTLEYMEFNMKEVEDYGVLLSSHGSSEQGVYTVVWKNLSTDMFGQYDFSKEARESTTVVDNTIAANDDLPVPPHPFVYDEEYYTQPPINFKVEHNPNESDLELR